MVQNRERDMKDLWNGEVEIDLKEIILLLWKNMIFLIETGLCVGAIVFIFCTLLISPTYTSTTEIYVLHRQSNGDTVTYSDLQAGNYLTDDYKELITSLPVMEKVTAQLHLKMRPEVFERKITVTSPDDTRIIRISVEDEDPYKARLMADTVRVAASEQIAKVMDIEAVKVVQEASYPNIKSAPARMRLTVFGGMMGGVLSVGILILRHLWDDTIKTEEDIENVLDLFVLGSVPRIQMDMQKAKDRTGESSGKIELHRLDEKIEYFANEAYKRLRTNLQLCGSEKQVILITSATPNEGKSTTAVNLAISLTEIEKTVCFIDADLRKSVLAGRYRIPYPVKGLSRYLAGQESMENILNETNIPELDMVLAGDILPNPAEMLSRERFHTLLKYVCARYDYVIIDAPPITSVVDAAVIAPQCDGIVMVTAASVVSRKQAIYVKQQLEKTNTPMLGVVLNKIELISDKYYGKYYGRD